MDDERLRDSLHRIADGSGESDASPASLLKRARLRLIRNASVVLVGVAALSTVGIIGLGQLDRSTVPPAHTSPRPIPSNTPSPSGSSAPAPLVFVYSFHGDLFGEYEDGTRRLLLQGTSGKPVLNPTVSPDMKAVVYQTGRGRKASLGYLTLRNGSQCCFREGSFPAFGPYDLVARAVSPNAPGGVSGLAIAIGVPTSEAEQVYLVPPDLTAVRDLSWDRTGEALIFRGIYKQSQRPIINGESLSERLFVGQVLYGPNHDVRNLTPLPMTLGNRHHGEEYWGPSNGLDINVLKVCCELNGHGTFSRIELGKLDPLAVNGAAYTKIVDLTRLGIDLQSCRCTTAYAGQVSARQRDGVIRWSRRNGQSWFVGDGVHLWWFSDTGTIVKMPFEVTGGVGVPNVLLGP